jgi:hypothetical protein
LLHASFRPRLAATPLRFARASPPSGCTGDFHPQDAGHARHTGCGAPASPARALVRVLDRADPLAKLVAVRWMARCDVSRRSVTNALLRPRRSRLLRGKSRTTLHEAVAPLTLAAPGTAMAELFKIAEARGEKRANAIFFHGLGGDAKSTWRAAPHESSFWPAWLAQDIEGLSVYSVGYEAPISRLGGSAMHLTDRAANVLARLLAEPALAQGSLVLIGHSFGGLVIKQLLRTAESNARRREELRISSGVSNRLRLLQRRTLERAWRP